MSFVFSFFWHFILISVIQEAFLFGVKAGNLYFLLSFCDLLLLSAKGTLVNFLMFSCLQRNLKVSTLKPTQSPWHPERSPHITDLVLRKTRWLLVSVSDPSPLGEISRSSWKKTGKRKVL